jgi:ubiquinone/menaquinone biosynthesis C-methylase UbiE
MPDNPTYDALGPTRTFWNSSPCNGQETLELRRAYRYRSEIWLPGMIRRIAGEHPEILEIGCGMGTDGLEFCAALPSDGSYIGIDYSNESVAAAKQAETEAEGTLNVKPTFQTGNAEALDFEDNSRACVFSFGVLHHTANEFKAFDEIHRVLKPGGKAYIFLYRKWSPKVTTAKFLRAVQKTLDFVFRTERYLYRLVKGRHFEGLFGTMILECFGVPYMKWYGKAEMRRMVSKFQINALYPIGYNLPWFHSKPEALTPFGYYWGIEIEKRAEAD